jgi:hypothetical protein
MLQYGIITKYGSMVSDAVTVLSLMPVLKESGQKSSYPVRDGESEKFLFRHQAFRWSH